MSMLIEAPPELSEQETPVPVWERLRHASGEENAELGVALEAERLDRMHPGWHDRIDIEALRMSSCTLCVLGQISGGRVGGFASTFEAVAMDARHHGEIIHEGAYALNYAKPFWVNEINKRRAA